MGPIIYSLCDRSLRALEPWAAAGYACVAIDIEPPLRTLPGVMHRQWSLGSMVMLPHAGFVMAGSGVIHPEPHHPAGTETKSYHPAYSGG